ncbi:MAG TPA: hypothetical protein VIH38_04870, partial [Steroidobacteraceae bacterium]
MEALVVRELRVEARGEKPALARSNDRTVGKARENVDARTDSADPRRANEHGMERLRPELLHVEVRLERVDLSPERVPLDGHVHERRERVRMAGDLFRNEDR